MALSRGSSTLLSVTIPTVAAAYGAGDVLGAPVKLPNAFLDTKGTALLQSIQLLDKDDQAAAQVDLYFFNVLPTTQGADNAAFAISDAEADNIVAVVSVLSGDWNDVGGAKIASKGAIGQLVQGVAGVKDLWVVAVARGTPTQTNNALRLKVGLRQD
jgi:hypothetical protein